MSNPTGDYEFSGLGFTGLRFFQDGSKYIGYLYFGQGSNIPVSNASFTEATGVVAFSAAESPTGVTDLTFTGNLIQDVSGDVTAISGTWTGRTMISATTKVAASPAAAAAPAAPTTPSATAISATNPPRAAAHVATAALKINPVLPIFQVHGAWIAFNRQNIIV